MRRYTMRKFHREFPNDAGCLHYLACLRWPNGIHCPKCERMTKHHLMTTRRSFSCQECGHHVHPTAETIYHKSTTPLTSWFHVLFLMAQTRGEIAAKQVERETGVTYKTAWHMCTLIRSSFSDGLNPFVGNVEVDETYIGGHRPVKHGHPTAGKAIVLGTFQRN